MHCVSFLRFLCTAGARWCFLFSPRFARWPTDFLVFASVRILRKWIWWWGIQSQSWLRMDLIQRQPCQLVGPDLRCSPHPNFLHNWPSLLCSSRHDSSPCHIWCRSCVRKCYQGCTSGTGRSPSELAASNKFTVHGFGKCTTILGPWSLRRWWWTLGRGRAHNFIQYSTFALFLSLNLPPGNICPFDPR